jgi:hypothetical protein
VIVTARSALSRGCVEGHTKRRLAAESNAKFHELLVEKLKFAIAKLRHEKFGQSSERSAILEQLELQLWHDGQGLCLIAKRLERGCRAFFHHAPTIS